MIKVEKTAGGCACQAKGSTFGLVAECAAAVDSVTKIVQGSAKKPIDYEAALQMVMSAVYEALHNGIEGEVLFHEKT